MRGKRVKQIRKLAIVWAKKKGLFDHRKYKLFYRNLKKAYSRRELHLPKV